MENYESTFLNKILNREEFESYNFCLFYNSKYIPLNSNVPDFLHFGFFNS